MVIYNSKILYFRANFNCKRYTMYAFYIKRVYTLRLGLNMMNSVSSSFSVSITCSIHNKTNISATFCRKYSVIEYSENVQSACNNEGNSPDCRSIYAYISTSKSYYENTSLINKYINL